MRAAITGAEHAALRIRSIRMAERGDIGEIGVVRGDQDAADLLRIIEADLRPGLSSIARAVHAVTLRDIRTHVGLAAADVDDIGVGGGNGEGADRTDRLFVEDRIPGASGVDRLPDTAVHGAEVEVVRLARHAADGEHATAAKRADQTPVQMPEGR